MGFKTWHSGFPGWGGCGADVEASALTAQVYYLKVWRCSSNILPRTLKKNVHVCSSKENVGLHEIGACIKDHKVSGSILGPPYIVNPIHSMKPINPITL